MCRVQPAGRAGGLGWTWSRARRNARRLCEALDRGAQHQAPHAIALRRLLEKHIAPSLGDIGIGSLSADNVNRWYSKTLTDKPTTRSHAYGLLHAVCASAAEDDLIARNPCQIKRAMSTNRKREPVLLSVNELAAVADAIQPQRFRALVLLSAWGALRFGEASELRRKDIGEGCEVISVSRAVTHRSGNDAATRCRIDTPKSGKNRNVVVPPHIRADIKHHLDTYVGPEPDALLFVSARGACHLSGNIFGVSFASACKTVGKEGIRVHDLRHLGATLAARAGATLAEVQARLGHFDCARGDELPAFRSHSPNRYRHRVVGDRRIGLIRR
jgi:integrase